MKPNKQKIKEMRQYAEGFQAGIQHVTRLHHEKETVTMSEHTLQERKLVQEGKTLLKTIKSNTERLNTYYGHNGKVDNGKEANIYAMAGKIMSGNSVSDQNRLFEKMTLDEIENHFKKREQEITEIEKIEKSVEKDKQELFRIYKQLG